VVSEGVGVASQTNHYKDDLSITTTTSVTQNSDGTAIVTVSIYSTWPNSPTLMRKAVTFVVPANKQRYDIGY
jgi:hypothetical protein